VKRFNSPPHIEDEADRSGARYRNAGQPQMPALTMISFINCPFCSGHETVSSEAAALIADLINSEINDFRCGDEPLNIPKAVKAELENIRNVILNTQEREAVDPLLS
jgi:hypothetical protein